jgi:hypothetical protein
VCNGRLANEGDGFLLGSEVTPEYCEVAAVYWSLVQERVGWWDLCVSCANLD